ncbi:acylneuraminate cytidylyltransferase [Roseiflexus castenholzii DSM 13941]|uniref:Acylneuraminate cytidylyltransferase n=2 Tax=Roseiflexus castenholzii TaxID=120962 RepID=A7NHE7_ROSCS|nr:acylneuraminate cytidylyltransferase [Roseiflexus castenholzii DSM 13941]
MLKRVVNRTARSAILHDVIVATTIEQEDETIVELCKKHGWPCFCGSINDVLDRYYKAARDYRVDVIVRITSDCPLIDPCIIDLVISKFLEKNPLDYASNTVQRSFPRGLDVEVVSFEALERAWHEDCNPLWREHVTPYIYLHPEKFALTAVVNNKDYSYMRWTVDTPEDLDFVRRVYDHFGHDNFSWKEVLAVLDEHQDWLAINSHIQQKVI